MRDLLNLFDNVLTESTGLANRKPGEKWQNSQGQTLTFNNIAFYPESGKVDSASDLVGLRADAVERQGRNVHWVNQANSSTGGFGIATFNDEQGNEADDGGIQRGTQELGFECLLILQVVGQLPQHRA